MADGPRFYGADLRCPTCGAPAIDGITGANLFHSILQRWDGLDAAKEFGQDELNWACVNWHANRTTLRIGEVTTRTL